MAGRAENIVVAAVAGRGSAQWVVGIGSGRLVPSDCWYYTGRWGPAGPRRERGTGPSLLRKLSARRRCLDVGRSFECIY